MADLDQITKYSFPAVGLLVLLGVVTALFMPEFVGTVQLLVGIVAFTMLLLVAIDGRFDIRGGMKGAVSVTLLGALFIVLASGVLGTTLGEAIGTTLTVPAIGGVLNTLALAVGGALALWGVIGAVKEAS